jgi:hypothetical protein
MNGNVGASFALSFLLVGVVAVVLYPPERHPPSPSGSEPIAVSAFPEPGAKEPLPPLTPTVPWADDQPSTGPAPQSSAPRPDPAASLTAQDPEIRLSDPVRRPCPGTCPDLPSDLLAPATPVVRPVGRRSILSGPRGPFTTSAAGETLADVARRVYGSAAAAHDLWLANRDHVERPNAPLPAGTLLRTP